MTNDGRAILFFDGDCGLCSRSVKFLLKQDRKQLLYFAPIQGATAGSSLPGMLRQSLSTVVYKPAGTETLYLKSDAVLYALVDIHSRWKWLAQGLRLLPKSFRDLFYDLVANNRHKLFKNKGCALPTPEESRRILP